jgi:hypothetical protein
MQRKKEVELKRLKMRFVHPNPSQPHLDIERYRELII